MSNEKITPKNTSLVRAMDENRLYKRIIGIHIFLGCTALVCAAYLHGYWISCLTAFLVCVCNGFRYQKIRERSSWNGISDTYLAFDGEKLSCRSIAGTVYESCLIYIGEIQTVVELTKKGECGFLIVLKSGDQNSYIAVNQKIVDERVFEVNGSMYDTEEFVQIYKDFLNALPSDVELVHVRTQHKNWWPTSKAKKICQAVLPWIFVIGAVAVQYALQVLNISGQIL